MDEGCNWRIIKFINIICLVMCDNLGGFDHEWLQFNKKHHSIVWYARLAYGIYCEHGVKDINTLMYNKLHKM